MSDELQNLTALKALADLKRDRDLAQLASIVCEENLLRQGLAELDQMIDRQNVAVGENFGSLLQMQSQSLGAKWGQWEAQHRRKETTKLSQIAQRREILLRASKQAFGRCEVLENLEAKLATKGVPRA